MTLMEIAEDIRKWAIVIGLAAAENPNPDDAEGERELADTMNRWVEQIRFQAKALASLPAPATDTASALRGWMESTARALRRLEHENAQAARLPAQGEISRRYDAVSAAFKMAADDIEMALACTASLPAPHEPLYGFPGSSTKLASLPAPAAPEHAKGCQRGWDGCSCGVDAAPAAPEEERWCPRLVLGRPFRYEPMCSHCGETLEKHVSK
jgi:hypothetical protein